jgi:hypothetical protein
MLGKFPSIKFHEHLLSSSGIVTCEQRQTWGTNRPTCISTTCLKMSKVLGLCSLIKAHACRYVRYLVLKHIQTYNMPMALDMESPKFNWDWFIDCIVRLRPSYLLLPFELGLLHLPGKKGVRKNVEGSGHGLFDGTIPELSWRDWEEQR